MTPARASGEPFRRATGAAPAADGAVAVRPLAAAADYRECAVLQRIVWGEDFREVVPGSLLKVCQRVGGVAAGAFDEAGGLLGFVFGLTGVEDGRLVHWSHMLAVRPEHRDRGIGRQLKEFQRAWLRVRGVERVYWTFDPLVARNAHLNLNRLHADIADYIPDMYGEETGSALHRGLGTDRFVVVWRIAGEENGERGPAPAVLAATAGPQEPAPDLPLEREVRIEVPDDIFEIVRSDPQEAVHWRRRTRRAFLWYLGHGYEVARFERDPAGGPAHYVLRSGGRA
jgi:chorismate synthase